MNVISYRNEGNFCMISIVGDEKSHWYMNFLITLYSIFYITPEFSAFFLSHICNALLVDLFQRGCSAILGTWISVVHTIVISIM